MTPTELASTSASVADGEIIALHELSKGDSRTPSLAQSSPTTADRDEQDETPLVNLQADLPPMDVGKGAWTFVAAAFVLETVFWGLPYSSGVLQEYYLSHEPFMSSSEQTIGAIGTVAIGLLQMQLIVSVPILNKIYQQRPNTLRMIMYANWLIACVSLLLASFATSAWQLILTQGILFGSSANVAWSPIMIYLPQWFARRTALAAGLIFAGSGIGGCLFPLLINSLLANVGFAWTMRTLSAIVTVFGGLGCFYLRPRLPPTVATEIRAEQWGRFFESLLADFTFLRNPLFYLVSFTSIAQGSAYYTVSLYLPSYASAVGLSPLAGSLALSIFNICAVFGQIVYGHLCDRFSYTIIIIGSTIGGAISSLLRWGFAGNDLAILFSFVVVFGTVSGGFTSVAAPAGKDLSGPGRASVAFSAISFARGFSIIIVPLIAAALRKYDFGDSKPPSGPVHYGGYGFTAIEIFVGCGMLASSLAGALAHRLKVKKE